jgi:hypothetical protein
MMFTPLDPEQEASFRAWARENYKPGDAINDVWHPIVQEECHTMNEGAEAPSDRLKGMELDSLVLAIYLCLNMLQNSEVSRMTQAQILADSLQSGWSITPRSIEEVMKGTKEG